MYSSTCLGRPHAHHQELNNLSSSLWFLPLERGGSSAVGRGRVGPARPRPSQFHPDPARKLSANLYDIYHCCVYSGKLLMMDRGTVRNM